MELGCSCGPPITFIEAAGGSPSVSIIMGDHPVGSWFCPSWVGVTLDKEETLEATLAPCVVPPGGASWGHAMLQLQLMLVAMPWFWRDTVAVPPVCKG